MGCQIEIYGDPNQCLPVGPGKNEHNYLKTKSVKEMCSKREKLKYLDKEDPNLARYDSNTYKYIYNFIRKGRIPHLQLPNDNDIFNVNICFLNNNDTQ